ncbi:MAG: PilZ domain-containing protein [Planctomycetota bacterium]
MNRQVVERRKNHRVDMDLPTPTLDLMGDGKPALLKNISLSGLSCIASTEIPEMTMVDLRIQLPALPEEEPDNYPFTCKGAVIRCEPLNRGNTQRRWDLAIYFTEVDEANKAILEKYIERRS